MVPLLIHIGAVIYLCAASFPIKCAADEISVPKKICREIIVAVISIQHSGVKSGYGVRACMLAAADWRG